MATPLVEPRPFPVPDDFPLTWPTPQHAMMTFRQDRMHAPYPLTPMSAWWADHFAIGFTRGIQSHSAPMRVDVVCMNHYFYLGVNPAVPPEQMREHEERAAAAIQSAAPRTWDRWQGEWLPELKSIWDEWGRRDLRALSDADLIAAAREAVSWYERIWTIHFEMLVPVMVAAGLYEDVYKQLLPGREPLSAFKLLRGYDSMSLEAGRELWLIAQEAAADPATARLVRETPVDGLWNAICTNPQSAGLKSRLDGYLAMYGRRSDNVQEVASVSWTEDPAPALANLKAYLDDPTDPRETMARMAAEREELLAETRAAIAGAPPEARGAFEGLLQVAQAFGRLQEDHNFWIDQRGTHETRQLCLAIGDRLVQHGRLADRTDIFMLNFDEALAALAGELQDARSLAAQRRADMERWAKVTPPPMVGMDYGPPPDNPVNRAMLKFFGGPPMEAAAPRQIQGNAGAPGKVQGVARIVMSIDEGWKLEQDDILVTPTTAPPWTPFFATAAAVVTETGGVLSHCAIVAREYGIPAVVGAAGATAIIADSARIEVDGDAGTVTLLE